MEHEVARRRIVFLTSLFLLPTPVFVFLCFGWIPVGLQVALALLCNAYSMYYELVSERDACGDVW